MSEESPGNKVPAVVGFGFGLLSLGAISIADVWALAGGEPLWIALLLLGAAAVGFITGVIAKIIDAAKNWLAMVLRERMIAAWPIFWARYARKLSAHSKRRSLQGVETVDPFGPILQEVYVEVGLDRQWVKKHSGSLRARWDTDDPKPLEYFLRNDDAGVFTVTGSAGSGKTSMLRRTAYLHCNRPRWRRRTVPVLLYAREHLDAINNTPSYSLVEAAARQPWARDLPPEWIKYKLEHGRCLVLVDGVDEIAGGHDRYTFMEWIGREVEAFDSNDFVVTSRPHGFDDGNLEGNIRLQMLPFTVDTILKFLRGWFLEMEKRASGESAVDVTDQAIRDYKDLKAQLDRRPELYDVASRPLLLTMIANVHKYNSRLPGSRAELYKEMCAMLLRRQARGSSAEWEMTNEHHRELLSGLALSMTCAGRTNLSFDAAARTIEEIQRDYRGEVVGEDFLNDVVHAGLMVRDLNDSFSFVHSTFREYLTATALSKDRRGDLDLLIAHVEDPDWRDIIVLWCAVSDASPIVAACLDSMSGYAIYLAYECAEVAHRLNSEQSQRLEQLKRPGNTDADGLPVHLLNKVRRDCDDLLPLSEEVSVCRNPFSHELLRLNWEAAGHPRGELLAPEFKRGTPADNDPAHGLWPQDADTAVSWVDKFYGNERSYRLPDHDEMAMLHAWDENQVRQPVWVRSDGATRIFCPEGMEHPFTLDDVRFSASVLEDRWDTPVYLLVALAYLRAATKAQTGDDTFVNDFDHTINFEHAYQIARAFDRDADPDRSLEDGLRYALIRVRLGQSHSAIIDPDADGSPMLERIEETDRVRLFRRHSGLRRAPDNWDYTLVRAYSLFLTPWLSRPQVPSTGALASFDVFLMGQANDWRHQDVAVYPDELGRMLQRAVELIETETSAQFTAMRAMSRRVVDDVRAGLEPILQRRTAYLAPDARAARLGLLAASSATEFMGNAEATRLLRSAARGLAIVNARVIGEVMPTEVIRPVCERLRLDQVDS